MQITMFLHKKKRQHQHKRKPSAHNEATTVMNEVRAEQIHFTDKQKPLTHQIRARETKKDILTLNHKE
jgi:hypothetical protein